MSKYPPSFYFKLFRLHLKINGLRWTLLFSIKHFLVESLRIVERVSARLEKKLSLPGSHSVEENALKWNNYRWEHGENEWTSSAEWKQSVIDDIMLSNIQPGSVVIEIGPGFGRWTRKLIEISSRVMAVDVAEKCINQCREIFGDNSNAEFHVNDGRSLAFAADNSVDFIWSFDVFVHIEPEDIEGYLQEFRRVLKPDGVAIIHHGIIGNTVFEWRSSLTLQIFTGLLRKHDFTLIDQFSAWGDDNRFKVSASDVVSIFRKS